MNDTTWNVDGGYVLAGSGQTLVNLRVTNVGLMLQVMLIPEACRALCRLIFDRFRNWSRKRLWCLPVLDIVKLLARCPRVRALSGCTSFWLMQRVPYRALLCQQD